MEKKIRTVSYIKAGEKLVCTEGLTPKQKAYVATVLKMRYLNELFAGRAVFEPGEPLPSAREVFPEPHAREQNILSAPPATGKSKGSPRGY